MTNTDVWPKNPGSHTVFLIDYRTNLEAKLIKSEIERIDLSGNFSVIELTYNESVDEFIDIDRLQAKVDLNEDTYFLPLRVVWSPSERTRVHTFKDVLLGSARNPGTLRQRLIYKKQGAYQIAVGQGATLKDLQSRFATNPSGGTMSSFVARSALLALDKEERRIKGSAYKVPRMVKSEVLGKPEFKSFAENFQTETGRELEEINQYAEKCLKEMAATPTPRGLDLAALLGRKMYTRGFDEKIEFLEGDLDRIRTLTSTKPVAFLFTHKSHIDGFLLISLFRDLNFPPIHTFGGINMGFIGLGTLLRKAGAIFIRRSFRGDEIYKAVFRSYIDYLGEKRFPIMWALEGTRSRTGKLMPPRFGLINYVVSAYQRDNAQDLVLMPISILYDQIPEIGDYDKIQAGGKKRPESASWFMQYLMGLKMPHGKIHVRFGQGLSISDYLGVEKQSSVIDRSVIQKIAFDLAVDTNESTPATVNSLITYVLLENGHRAVTLEELSEHIKRLISRIRVLGFKIAADIESLDEHALRRALDQLVVTGTVELHNDGIEIIYRIPHEKGRRAAYYRNGVIHCLITSAIGEVALLAVTSTGDQAEQEFQAEALRIRDFMKYEFFFESSEKFLDTVANQFDRVSPEWREYLHRGRPGVEDLIRSFDLLLGHGSLRPFFEAYLVFARALLLMPEGKAVDQKSLVDKSLALGKQRILQQRIHCEESVSAAYFENAMKIAEARALLDDDDDIVEGRQRLWEELMEITENIRYLASAMDLKRMEQRKLYATQEQKAH